MGWAVSMVDESSPVYLTNKKRKFRWLFFSHIATWPGPFSKHCGRPSSPIILHGNLQTHNTLPQNGNQETGPLAVQYILPRQILCITSVVVTLKIQISVGLNISRWNSLYIKNIPTSLAKEIAEYNNNTQLLFHKTFFFINNE